jgi:methylamine---glutamate N-methyltransferase subunit A
MCGIMGYLDKTRRDNGHLGATLLKMLMALGRRGPDSAGAAVYSPRGDEANILRVKLGNQGGFAERAAEVTRRVSAVAAIQDQEQDHEYLRLIIGFEGDPKRLQAEIEAIHPDVEVISYGTALDIVKQVGSPRALERRFGLERVSGTHALAHTRLSTESKIDLSHSQPFWAHGSVDLATVHNGHITNYHKLRRLYEQRGIRFYTENDSEIIGLYLAERLADGLSLEQALRSSITYFDGSFSYLAATADEIGFAKDPFGLKPLIVAETDQFVAIATEELALQAALGGAVQTWEPPAGSVRCWRVPGNGVAAKSRPEMVSVA